MASMDPHLSLKILTFLSNQINHIKDKTFNCQRILPFGRLPKSLKEILIISTIPVEGTHSRLAKQNNLCHRTIAM